jgi:formate-dependent nitrite reductase membrane component NrfD
LTIHNLSQALSYVFTGHPFFIKATGVLIVVALLLKWWCAKRKEKLQGGGYPPGTD